MSRAREIADLVGGTTPDIILKTADGAILNLQTSDTTVTDGSVLGAINFTAPNEGSGTDAITVGAAIQAVAEGTFAADNNATELVFMTGASEAASSKMTLSSSGNLTIISSDAGAGTGPRFDITRNSATPAANDILGQIRFMGEDAADNSLSYISIFGQLIDPTDGSEDGSLEIDVRLAGTNRSRILANATETIFNDDSVDLDFRVESNGNTHMIFVDGGSDHVNIGTANDLGSGFNVLTEMSLGADNNNRGIINFSSNILSFGTVQGGSATFSSLKVSSGGVTVANGLTLTDGNLVVAAGHGIDFAAQTPSSATGASTGSELLDHYEEGTWTPTVLDIGGNAATMASNSQRGKYIRIGTLVIANFGFTMSSKGSMTGNFTFVAGIPFGHSGTNAGTAMINRFSGLSGAISSMSMEIGGGITNVAWFTDVAGTGSTGDGYLTASQISDSFFCQGTLVYSIV